MSTIFKPNLTLPMLNSLKIRNLLNIIIIALNAEFQLVIFFPKMNLSDY